MISTLHSKNSKLQGISQESDNRLYDGIRVSVFMATSISNSENKED